MQLYDSDRYQPSVEDVLAVKDILFTLRPDSPIPLELIDAILDVSEYWPHTTTSFPKEQGPINVRAGGEGENKFMLRSLPIGFVQDDDDSLRFQILPEYQSDYASKLKPKPWPKDRDIPQDATENVIAKWSERSQPRGEFPCKKIVFRIKSHDQGWGGELDNRGTYRGSYTWFDVGLERTSATREAGHLLEAWEKAPFPQFRLSNSDTHALEWTNEIVCSLCTISPDIENNPNSDPEHPLVFKHTLNPDNKCLQKNRTATRESQENTIIWRYNDAIHPEGPEADALEAQGRGRNSANGEFVRSLKTGDAVTIWAKARYPGWTNIVEDVSMDVYWAV